MRLQTELQLFVMACNRLRSAQRAAHGYVSGKRLAELKGAQQEHRKFTRELSDWFELQARQTLNPPGSDPAQTPCGPALPEGVVLKFDE